MNEWFESLDPRERQFVSIGASVALIALAYGLGWAPFDKKHDELKADVAKWEDTGHASFFTRMINGETGYYKASCIECHTVGYDTTTNAVKTPIPRARGLVSGILAIVAQMT